MKLRNMLPYRTLFAGLALLGAPASAVSAIQSYCSNENTGSDFSAVYDIYMSNGYCIEECIDDYALGIVQGKDCWCSDYLPANQLSVSECDEACPGYPDDSCGNTSEDLYGYIVLSIAVSGTSGASSTQASTTAAASTTSTTQPVSISIYPSTVFVSVTSVLLSLVVTPSVSVVTFSTTATATVTPSLTSVVSQSSTAPLSTSVVSSTQPLTTSSATTTSATTTPTSITTSTSTSTTSSVATVTVTPTEVTSTSSSSEAVLSIVTLSGTTVTYTVTSTPAASSSIGDISSQQSTNTRLGGGAIAGIVIGVLAGLALVALLAFWLWRRRKNDQEGETNTAEVAPAPKSPKRNISVLSKSGLLNRPWPETSGRDDDPWATGATGNSSTRHSMLFGPEAEVSPVSPLGSSHDDSRRDSRPFVYDQRLNPSALFPNHDNGSRVSMQDTQDYSRPLGVANPDLRPSFDSRFSRE